MAEPISRQIFVHQIDNVLAHDLGVKIIIPLKNSNVFELNFLEKSAHKTKFELIINDYSTLGFTNAGQVSVETFFNKLLLSFNLVLQRPVMTTYDIIYSQIQLSSESVGVVIGFSEEIDENKILEFFHLITTMENTISKELETNNLQKSLSTYQNAVESNLPLLIFKDLYASLELATNSDTDSRLSTNLDSEIANLSGIDVTTAQDWRQFYNRIKHVDKNSSNLSTFSQGTQNLNEYIKEIRKTCQKVILSRLKSL